MAMQHGIKSVLLIQFFFLIGISGTEENRLVLDLIFAFDGSKSITKENWIQQVELVQNLLHRLRFSNKGTHVGIIDFSDHIHDRVRLVDGYKDSYIFTKLKDMKAHFEGGSHTYTDKALADAAKLFKESPLSRDAPPVLVVLTDGKMTLQDHFKGVRLVKERTAELKALGVKIFCITFGKAIYIEGLHSIVGLHADKDIFHAQSFNATEFVQRLQELFRREKAISEKLKNETSLQRSYETACNETFLRIGCFYDHHVSPRPMPELIFTDRNTGHEKFSGTKMDLINWNDYMSDLVCRCARNARLMSYVMFSLQFYGECYGNKLDSGFAKDGPALSPKACISKDLKPCDSADKKAFCVGKQYHNYVYYLRKI